MITPALFTNHHHHSFPLPFPVQPWRNPDGTVNMIVEIPKWSRRKFEIATGELFNPIKQDVKNGTLREYGWGDMIFNYGCVPQTWEDPKFVHPDTGAGGDNDPIDIVDVGAKMWSVGSIVRVKVLGVLAMIDDGETVSTHTPTPHLPSGTATRGRRRRAGTR